MRANRNSVIKDYQINSTADYYVQAEISLGWELTVCNALEPKTSPCRSILIKNAPYGALLYHFLQGFLPMDRIRHLIEIGGGYGYLMKAFLYENPDLKPIMLDISPYLLSRQRETLREYPVQYVQGDFLEYEPGLLASQELAVFNENLGDFHTALHINREILNVSKSGLDPVLKNIRRFFDQYKLEKPQKAFFDFNLGALQVVEKLCRAGVPCIFLAEHSCEADAPSDFKKYIRNVSKGEPEKISLHGHLEYTIKFSYLVKTAQALGYRILRGLLADFIPIRFEGPAQTALASQGISNDELEIIRQFVEDLFKYEYLILIKE